MDKILSSPIFKLVEEKKLSDEIEDIKKLIFFLKDLNPKMNGFLITKKDGNSYILIFGNVKLERIIKLINATSDFLLIGHNNKKVVFKFKGKKFNFVLIKNGILFSKANLKNFNIARFYDTYKDIKDISSNLGLILPPDEIEQLWNTNGGKFQNIIKKWKYILLYPEKYNPFILNITVKCKDVSSSKDTQFFIDAIRSTFSEILQSNPKYSNFFQNFKVETSTNGSRTIVKFIFAENFLDLFK